ncbi:hypothetical protein PRIPAC_81439, partial [Pristionchus pacificus]|uniref:Uncharacterized protein n=1 Tax=Pristionchus pacificus TaxID=54126 RepID=A0A2A6CQP9_PRIPA
VDGICFTTVSDSVPRNVIVQLPFTTNASCRIECMQITNCDSVYYSDATQKCFILGKAGNATCGMPFFRLVMANKSCSQYNLTANYATFNPCIASAVILRLDSQFLDKYFHVMSLSCPSTPVNGDASARFYLLSVIFPSGKYAVFGNNPQAGIFWYQFSFQIGHDVFVNEPVYAASYAYDPAGGKTLIKLLAK